MSKHTYQDAKVIIETICNAAKAGDYETRKSFFDMVERNPHLAVQGYNAFGKIFYWNDASARLYGHSESSAVNKDLIELILPPEMRKFARDMISNGRKTGRMPEASACDLLRYNGEYVTVFSGHLVFQWDEGTMPEFYCVDLPLVTEEDEVGATVP